MDSEMLGGLPGSEFAQGNRIRVRARSPWCPFHIHHCCLYQFTVLKNKQDNHARVERELPRVWVFGCTVGNDHLRHRKPIEDRPDRPIVVVRDRRQCDAFAVTEAYPHICISINSH